jgi:hypothetical protein
MILFLQIIYSENITMYLYIYILIVCQLKQVNKAHKCHTVFLCKQYIFKIICSD